MSTTNKLWTGLAVLLAVSFRPAATWNESVRKSCFWSLNIGLSGMALFTLLPLGILQLIAAIDHGYWFARSADFMQQPIVDLLVWLRVPGDVIFSVGALALAWFVLRLWIAPRRLDVALPDGTVPARR